MRLISSLLCWRQQGGSPKLHKAICNGSVTRRQIIKAKQIDKVDKYERTILHNAVMMGNKMAIKTIAEEAARRALPDLKNAADYRGNTALHLAVHNGCTHAISQLLDMGCDDTILNNLGALALSGLDEDTENDSDGDDKDFCEREPRKQTSKKRRSSKKLQRDCASESHKHALEAEQDACSVYGSVHSCQVAGEGGDINLIGDQSGVEVSLVPIEQHLPSLDCGKSSVSPSVNENLAPNKDATLSGLKEVEVSLEQCIVPSKGFIQVAGGATLSGVMLLVVALILLLWKFAC